MVIKHAFLIGAYKNPDYLLELIDSLDSEKSSFYIHVNLINDNEFGRFKELIKQRKNIHYYSDVKIKWGGSGLFYSQMLLLNAALKDQDNSYFHFITGQDVLCRPLVSFFDYIEKSDNCYVQYAPMPEKWEYRYACFTFFDILNLQKKGFLRALNRVLIIIQEKLHIKRSDLGFKKIYYGSGWWSLTREAAFYLASKWNSDARIRKRIRNTFAPDEMLVQTVLLNADKEFRIINENLRYIKWIGDSHPDVLNEYDFFDVIKTDKFFARKIDPVKSADFIKKIRDYIK